MRPTLWSPWHWHFGPHHQVVGLDLPQPVATRFWPLRGGPGFQGTRVKLSPNHLNLRSREDMGVDLLLMGNTAEQVETLWADLIPGDLAPGQIWEADDAVAIVADQQHQELLRQVFRRWSRADAAVIPGGQPERQRWVIASRVPPQERAAVLRHQRSQQRLIKAAAQTGLPQAIEAAGRRVRQLVPVWENPTLAEGLAFHLVADPVDPARSGLYRPEEIQAWLRHEGPVEWDASLAAEEARHKGVRQNLLSRFNAAGFAPWRWFPVWLGEGKHRHLGYQISPRADQADLCPEGRYSVEELQHKFPLPVEPSPLAQVREWMKQRPR